MSVSSCGIVLSGDSVLEPAVTGSRFLKSELPKLVPFDEVTFAVTARCLSNGSRELSASSCGLFGSPPRKTDEQNLSDNHGPIKGSMAS